MDKKAKNPRMTNRAIAQAGNPPLLLPSPAPCKPAPDAPGVAVARALRLARDKLLTEIMEAEVGPNAEMADAMETDETEAAEDDEA